MEIEDYRDFAKAADALGEAEKSVTKGLEKAPNAALEELQSTTHRFRKQLEKFQTIKGWNKNKVLLTFSKSLVFTKQIQQMRFVN